MFFIGYFKGEPNEFILRFKDGQIVARGNGISFFYLTINTSIVRIPINTIDVPFILNEATGNFQGVTVQGQFTYRVTKPDTLAGMLNYAIDPGTREYLSDDPEKPGQRIVNELQRLARDELLRLTLEEALKQPGEIAERVLAALRGAEVLAQLGVEVVTLHVVAIRPTPEMAKALEAEYRESLQVKADQAIYNRRALAVDQERRIKENELTTSITLETKRQKLVELEGNNEKAAAEFEAAAAGIRLGPFRDLPPSTLLGLAMKDLGTNAEKIGNLTITTEILAGLLNGSPTDSRREGR